MSTVRQADSVRLNDRLSLDFRDYGFLIHGRIRRHFDVYLTRLDDEEAFLFFYPKDTDVEAPFALFNLHCYLKRTGSIENFAHSLGASVASLSLEPVVVFGIDGLTYSRRITMRDLFEGAPNIIDFIEGRPEMSVRDSHTYFRHRHAHYYTGMLHESDDDLHYDALRSCLLCSIELV